MSKFNAKEILKDKFWILQQNGENMGTISIADDSYMLSDSSGTRMFNSEKQLKKKLGNDLSWQKLDIKETFVKEVHGFPTSSMPYNPMYDVRRKLPLFTKSTKSKSLYAAGYYTIRFEKGWVKSFCPKLLTLERYEYRGPFKTDIEMRTELSRVSK